MALPTGVALLEVGHSVVLVPMVAAVIFDRLAVSFDRCLDSLRVSRTDAPEGTSFFH